MPLRNSSILFIGLLFLGTTCKRYQEILSDVEIELEPNPVIMENDSLVFQLSIDIPELAFQMHDSISYQLSYGISDTFLLDVFIIEPPFRINPRLYRSTVFDVNKNYPTNLDTTYIFMTQTVYKGKRKSVFPKERIGMIVKQD